MTSARHCHCLLAVFIGVLAVGQPTAAATWACGDSRVLDLHEDRPVDLAVPALPIGARLIVSERGADARVQIDNGPLQLVSYPMTRFGSRRITPPPSAFSVRVSLWRSSHGRIGVRVDCDPVSAARAQWLQRAQSLAESIDQSVQSRPQLDAFAQLLAEAKTPLDRASALHMQAGALYLVDRYADSAATYAQAREAWLKIGESSRAGAAQLGVADLEMKQERHQQADRAAVEALSWLTGSDDGYFRARARSVHCAYLDKIGKAIESANCGQPLIEEYRSAGDPEGALSTAVNVLNSLRMTAQLERTWKFAQKMENDPLLAKSSPKVRGVFYFTVAYLESERGNLPQALHNYERAIDSFEHATEERVRWQANVLVQVAKIYGQLGMSDQAYRLIERSLLLYRPESSPARVASALMALARLEMENTRSASAAKWFERAYRIYDLLAMPVERAEALLGMLEQRLPATPEEATAELAQVRDWSALASANAGRRDLLEVRWLIVAEQLERASQRLGLMNAKQLQLGESMSLVRLSAQLSVSQSNGAAAVKTLTGGLESLTSIAARTRNGAFGYLVLRSGRRLREDWATRALASVPPLPMEQWWQALVSTSPMQAMRPQATASSDNSDFSAAVSRELLGAGTSQVGASERALLTSLAGKPDAIATHRRKIPTLAAIQAQLGDGWLTIVVPAEPESVALWVSAKESHIVRLPGRDDLRARISRLLTSLNSPTAPTSAIDAAALQVSDALLRDAPTAAPSEWSVLSDDLIGTIPLSLLRWPGASAPLIETTTSGWITRIELTSAAPTHSAFKHLHAVIAPGNTTTAQVGLAKLRYAEQEADLIARADSDLVLLRHTGAQASRATLTEALGDAGAWVHLAAHGFAEPQLLGYAGTWLANPADVKKSQFLSWLDIANTPLHAQLAVLNACQLAAGPSVTSQSSLSFAAAVSAAGVDHVVAAFWPISDSASAVWIPAFYAAMRGRDAAASASALRLSQLALKNSRAYRHPYYWASLAHFRRLSASL